MGGKYAGQAGLRIGLADNQEGKEQGVRPAPVFGRRQGGKERPDGQPEDQHRRDQARENPEHPRQRKSGHVARAHQAGRDHVAGKDKEAVERKLHRAVDEFREGTGDRQADGQHDGVPGQHQKGKGGTNSGEIIGTVFQPPVGAGKQKTGPV